MVEGDWVGPPDSLAIMNMPGAWEGYQSILPKGTSWKNACPARAVFTTSFYRPIRHAQRVRCPVLLVMAKRDEVIPQWSVKKEQARLSNAQLVALNSGHFELYNGLCFEEAVVAEQNFLQRICAGADVCFGLPIQTLIYKKTGNLRAI